MQNVIERSQLPRCAGLGIVRSNEKHILKPSGFAIALHAAEHALCSS
jgi:hypothetical protein